PPQAELISAVGTIGSASLSPSKPDRPPPLGRPELIGKPCTRSPANPQEDLRRVQLARTSSHRSTRDPPPGHSKLPRHHVENFGIGQNTGETLPKFRQKSKGNLKRI
ncbi:cyclic nucleotide gated channel 1, partial [Prunus dulcis]